MTEVLNAYEINKIKELGRDIRTQLKTQKITDMDEYCTISSYFAFPSSRGRQLLIKYGINPLDLNQYEELFNKMMRGK
jgi:hypothetical protein